jgi:hypothetical protein
VMYPPVAAIANTTHGERSRPVGGAEETDGEDINAT